MKKLYEQAKLLSRDADDISRELFKYNDGLQCEKMPCSKIIKLMADLMYRYAILRVDLVKEGKLKNYEGE